MFRTLGVATDLGSFLGLFLTGSSPSEVVCGLLAFSPPSSGVVFGPTEPSLLAFLATGAAGLASAEGGALFFRAAAALLNMLRISPLRVAGMVRVTVRESLVIPDGGVSVGVKVCVGVRVRVGVSLSGSV